MEDGGSRKKAMKFKVGDRVQIIKANNCGDHKVGEVGVITYNDGAPEGSNPWHINMENRSTHCADTSELKLLESTAKVKQKPIRFVLKYDLDQDPIEEFETLKELNHRIKELLKRSDLKRDTMVVYEIKSKKVVKVDTRISLRAA